MKRICKKCNHKCHCKGQGYYVSDSSCEDYCKCKNCCHNEEDLLKQINKERPMIKKLWKKFIDWVFDGFYK